jgi:pimeloyl-ACP methyl ester carboxylesterase
MRTSLTEIPELPTEEHPLFVLPEHELLLPAAPTGNPAEQGRVVRYREAGQGRPVLLLHGPWTSIFAFRNLVYPLQGEHRLIIPEVLDLIGDPMGVLPAQLAQSTIELITALNLKHPVIVGQAECGIAALDLAVSKPEALAAVVVLDSSLQCALPQRLKGRWLARRWASKHYAYRCFANPHEAALALISPKRSDLLSCQEIRYLAHRFASLPLTRHTTSILAQTLAPLYHREAAAVLRRIREKTPALMIRLVYTDVDDKHQTSHKHGETLKNLLPGSELFIAEAQVENPAVLQPAWIANIIAEASKAAG